jgi:hypothetical protein
MELEGLSFLKDFVYSYTFSSIAFLSSRIQNTVYINNLLAVKIPMATGRWGFNGKEPSGAVLIA